jgi:hypothetical protein
MVDRRCHLIFDWIRELPRSVTQERYRLYTNPVGPERDFSDTNMVADGTLRPPFFFCGTSVHCLYGSMTNREIEEFRERYVLSLWVLEKRIWNSPLAAIPRHGMLLPMDLRKAFKETFTGAPRQPNEFGDFPIILPPLMPFRMELEGKPLAVESGLKFLCGLNGIMDFPVQ